MTNSGYNPITLAATNEKEIFDELAKTVRKHVHTIISASAPECTIGCEHLMNLPDFVEPGAFIHVPETNGVTLSDIELIYRKDFGAGDGIRTHDFNLGKVALYP